MQGQQIKVQLKIDDGKQHPKMDEIQEGVSKVAPQFDLMAGAPPEERFLKADAYQFHLDEESAEKVDTLPDAEVKEEPVQQKVAQFKRREDESQAEAIQLKAEGEAGHFPAPPVQRREEEKDPFQFKGERTSSLDNPEPFQFRQENRTGMPDRLKSGVEQLSGQSMDDVRVHFNSEKPAQMKALAYAQGSEIHLGPGQEQHLPHEAWHVAQQKQGRVSTTKQFKGAGLNDDPGLEREADIMGAKAMQIGGGDAPRQLRRREPSLAAVAPVQRVIVPGEGRGEYFDDVSNEDYCFIYQHPNSSHAYYAKRSELEVMRNRIITGDITYNPNMDQNAKDSILKTWFTSLSRNKIDNTDPGLVAYGNVQFIEVEDDQQANVALPIKYDGQVLAALLGQDWGHLSFRQMGYGDRAPKAKGIVLVNELSSLSNDRIIDLLEADQRDFDAKKRFEGVQIKRYTPLDYQNSFMFSPKPYYVSGYQNDFFYISDAVRKDATKDKDANYQNYMIEGHRYSSLAEIEGDKGAIGPKYQKLVANRSVRDWAAVGRRGSRDGTQAQAMEGWNALGAAAYAKQVLGMKLNIDQDWEWLHIQGVQNGGVNAKDNLGSGTWKANSAMIPYENKIRQWGNERGGNIYARYEAETQNGSNSPILKKITIKIYADATHSIGPIHQNDPVVVQFDATQGTIQDGFANRVEMQDLKVQAGERQASQEFRQDCNNFNNVDINVIMGHWRKIYQSNYRRAAMVLTEIPINAFDGVNAVLEAVDAWNMALYLARFFGADQLSYRLIQNNVNDVLNAAPFHEMAVFFNCIDEVHFIEYFGRYNDFVQNQMSPKIRTSHLRAYAAYKLAQQSAAANGGGGGVGGGGGGGGGGNNSAANNADANQGGGDMEVDADNNDDIDMGGGS